MQSLKFKVSILFQKKEEEKWKIKVCEILINLNNKA